MPLGLIDPSMQKVGLPTCKNLSSFFLRSLTHSVHIHPLHSSSVHSFSTLRAKTSTPKISVFDYLVNHQHFSPDIASKAFSAATVKNLKDPAKADFVLSYLEGVGFSRAQIETVVQRIPRILSSDVDNVLKPRVQVFQDAGFQDKDIAEFIARDPGILKRSIVNILAPSVAAVKNVVGSVADATILLKKSAAFLRLDLRATMLPNIEIAQSCGLSQEQTLRFLSNFPRFFLFKPERVKEYVRKVEEMGFGGTRSIMFLYAVRVVSSMSSENWEKKLKLLRELGFSGEDIVAIFNKQPMALATSDRKLKQVVEFLVSEANLDIPTIVKSPGLLIASVEKRFKPRLRVIQALQRNNLLSVQQKMTRVYRMGHVLFLKKYVLPYSDKVKDLLHIAGGSK